MKKIKQKTRYEGIVEVGEEPVILLLEGSRFIDTIRFYERMMDVDYYHPVRENKTLYN